MYSLTKSLLATIELKPVARHVLELDLPIAQWLPAVPNANHITLRHLLRHASGLPEYGAVAAYQQAVKRGDPPWSDAEFFAHAQPEQLLFPPGQGWRYSNIGYFYYRS